MAWDNAEKFASKHGISTAKVPATMPQAMQFMLTFGKWEGASLGNVVQFDPGYVLYLLKTPKPPTDPVYAAAKLLKVLAERTLAKLEAIGNDSPGSNSMDELWPAAAEHMLQEALENDVGFQQDCNMERAERVSYAQADAYADAIAESLHGDWGNRD